MISDKRETLQRNSESTTALKGELAALTAKLEAAEKEDKQYSDEAIGLKIIIREQAAQMLQLIEAIKYVRGIAERGTQSVCPDDITIESFVLGYVKELEHDCHWKTAQIEALEKDAARYKWLKENKAHNNTHCWHFQHGPIIPGLLTLDAAIDAAMLGDSHGN